MGPGRPFPFDMLLGDSTSSLMPPSRVGRRPTISVMTLAVSSLWEEGIANLAILLASPRSDSLVEGSGSLVQSLGCFVPPMTVPPPKNRGMTKLHVPSFFCFVTVSVAISRSVRTVWPLSQVNRSILIEIDNSYLVLGSIWHLRSPYQSS